jgi:hypothetical protein
MSKSEKDGWKISSSKLPVGCFSRHGACCAVVWYPPSHHPDSLDLFKWSLRCSKNQDSNALEWIR